MSTRNLPPSIFAIVMATGIVAIAAHGTGMPTVAWTLFGLNLLLYPQPLGPTHHPQSPAWERPSTPTCGASAQGPRVLHDRGRHLHPRQSVHPARRLPDSRALALGAGLSFWILLTYTVLPWLMEQEEKPALEKGISGAWLVTVRRYLRPWACSARSWSPTYRTVGDRSSRSASGWSGECSTSG